MNTLQPSVKLEGHHTYHISCFAISGNRLFTGSYDHTIRVWDMTNHTEIACLLGHTNWVFCLSVTGNTLYSGGADKTIRVWNLDTITEVALIMDSSNWVEHVQISAGRIHMAAGVKIVVRLL